MNLAPTFEDLLRQLEEMMTATETVGDCVEAGASVAAYSVPSFALMLGRIYDTWHEDYVEALASAIRWKDDLSPADLERCLNLSDDIAATHHVLQFFKDRLLRATAVYAIAHEPWSLN